MLSQHVYVAKCRGNYTCMHVLSLCICIKQRWHANDDDDDDYADEIARNALRVLKPTNKKNPPCCKLIIPTERNVNGEDAQREKSRIPHTFRKGERDTFPML